MGMFSRGGSSSALACDELYLQPKLPHAHVAADLRYLPASINTDSHVRVIDAHRACEGNNENMAPFFNNGWTLFHLCERLCLLKKNCYAFDYYQKTKFCSFWEKPCKHPLTTKDGASSYEVTTKGCPQAGSGDGMMGILGNPTKYVCNAVQTVLAHLSNASNVTFQTTLVAKSDRRFWQAASAANDTKLGQTMRHRSMSEQLAFEEGGDAHADNAQAKTRRKVRLTERSSVRKDMHVSVRHNEAADTPPQESPLQRGDPEISLSNARHMRRALSRFTWDGNISAEPPARGSVRRRVSSVKSYTIPAHPRPGKRCALAKRDLGDDLLTVVAVVPIGPWDFGRREIMRKYLIPSAHKLRSRRYYRKIVTTTTRKRAWLSKADQNFVNKLFSDSKHQSKKHNWGWFKKYVGKPVEDNRAVCVDVIFMVSRQPIWLQHHC